LEPLTVSVVVNTYNRAASLDTALRSLRRLNYPYFEIVVVNGPSTDGTLELLKQHASSVRVGTCSDRNLSVSRNVGIDMARGDLVAFIDDDAVADENWLNDAVAGFESDQVAAVGGIVYNHTGYDIQYRYTMCDRLGNCRLDRTTPAVEFNYPGCLLYPSLQGGNSIFRRTALLEIGGFDEEFDYSLDETDVCVRLIDAGYLLKQLPHAFVYHRNLSSQFRRADGTVTNWRSSVKNKLYFSLKHAAPEIKFREILAATELLATRAEQHLRARLEKGTIGTQEMDQFYQDVDQAFREGIARGLTQPRRSLYSAIAREKRGPIAQDVLDEAHRGVFKRCPTVLDAARKLTVCLLSEDYSPSCDGTSGSVTYDLACGLAERGHMVHVLTQSSCGHNTVDFENEVWVHRLVQDSPPSNGEADAAQAGKPSTVLVRELRRIHETHPIDIVETPLSPREGAAAFSNGRFVSVVGRSSDFESLELAVTRLLAVSGSGGDFGQTGAERLHQHYTKEKLADWALEFYDRVLNSRPQAPAHSVGWVGMRSALYSHATDVPAVPASSACPEEQKSRIHASRPQVQRTWAAALGSELAFWDAWFKTKGSQWPEDYRNRLNPDLPLMDFLLPLLPQHGEVVRILDVGAGPLSVLGTKCPGRKIELRAVDPLADEYNRLLAAHAIVPRTRTEKCDAEQLLTMFPPNFFDLAYAQNCLDHSYNPLLAIEQMLLVVKPGAYVRLEHATDEGARGNYGGLHQWNFTGSDRGHFIIWNSAETIDVTEVLAGRAVIDYRERLAGKDQKWCSVTLRRRAPLRDKAVEMVPLIGQGAYADAVVSRHAQ
jgi:GT2 family glycosyltransferase/SAM-dependent methyltransferase